MRLLLSTFGSRGDVQPLAALAAALRTLGAETVVVAPPDRGNAELLAGVGAAFVPAFTSVRAWLEEAPKRKVALPVLAAEIMGATFETIAAAAEGCDAIVATGLFPSTAAACAIAERRGIGFTYGAYCPAFLPSLHHRPYAFPGHPIPPEVTDNAALWALNAEAMEAIFAPAWNANRARIGLAPASGIRDLVFTDRPLLAADPILAPWQAGDLTDVVQTGAWILPDARPLPADLVAFLESGSPPVYVGYGSMPMAAAPDAGRVAVEAARARPPRDPFARMGRACRE